MIRNVTVSMDTDGSFYASILVERELVMETDLRELAASGATEVPEDFCILGLDYAQDCLYVDSDGNRADHPKYFCASQEKLAKLQKKMSRLEKGSTN